MDQDNCFTFHKEFNISNIFFQKKLKKSRKYVINVLYGHK